MFAKPHPLWNKTFSEQCAFFASPKTHAFSARVLFSLPLNNTKKQLTRAYKSLARYFHPDRHGNSLESKEAFQGLVRAKEYLEFCFLSASEQTEARSNYEGNPFYQGQPVSPIHDTQPSPSYTSYQSSTWGSNPSYSTGRPFNPFYYTSSVPRSIESYDYLITRIHQNKKVLNAALREAIKSRLSDHSYELRFSFLGTQTLSKEVRTEHEFYDLDLFQYLTTNDDIALFDWLVENEPFNAECNPVLILGSLHRANDALFLHAIKHIQLKDWDTIKWLFFELLEHDRAPLVHYLLEQYPLYFKGVFDEVSGIPSKIESVAMLRRILAFGFKGDLKPTLLNALESNNISLVNALVAQEVTVSLREAIWLRRWTKGDCDDPSLFKTLFAQLDLSTDEAFEQIKHRLVYTNSNDNREYDQAVPATSLYENRGQTIDFLILFALSQSNMLPEKQDELWLIAWNKAFVLRSAPKLALNILKHKPNLVFQRHHGLYSLQRALMLKGVNDRFPNNHSNRYDEVAQKIIEHATGDALNSDVSEGVNLSEHCSYEFYDGCEPFPLGGWTTLHIAVGMSFKKSQHPYKYINHSAERLVDKLSDNYEALNAYRAITSRKYESIDVGTDYDSSDNFNDYDYKRKCRMTPLHLAIRNKSYTAIYMAGVNRVDFNRKADTWRVDEWPLFFWKSKPYRCQMTPLELAVYYKSAVGVRAVQLRQLNDYIEQREKEALFTSRLSHNMHHFFHVKIAYSQDDKLAAAYALQRMISEPASDDSSNDYKYYGDCKLPVVVGDELSGIDKRHQGALHQGRLGNIAALSYVSKDIRSIKAKPLFNPEPSAYERFRAMF